MAIDLELIERCRRGDRRAFGELYAACREPLLRVCEAITGDGEAAEDVLHDGFIVVMGGMGQLRDSSKAEGWMRRIMTNLALRYRDEAVRTVRLGSAAGAAEAAGERQAPVPAIEELLSMVDSLPEGYGRVFRLAVLDGLSHEEIAAMLGIAPKSSSSQLCRARAPPPYVQDRSPLASSPPPLRSRPCLKGRRRGAPRCCPRSSRQAASRQAA